MSGEIQELDDWKLNLMYEFAMSYSTEGLRKSFWEYKDSVSNIDKSALLDPDMGYTEEEIEEMMAK